MPALARCPFCQAQVIFEKVAGSSATCPACGAKMTVKPKSRPTPSSAPVTTIAPTPEDAADATYAMVDEPAEPVGMVEAVGVAEAPRGPKRDGGPGPARAKRKKKAARPKNKKVLALAGGAGVLAAGLLLVARLLSGSGGGGVDEDRQQRAGLLKVNDIPPVAWTLKPGPAPAAELPDQFTLPDAQSAIPVGWENFLVVQKGDKWLYGRFDLKTGRAGGEPVALPGPFDGDAPHAFSPTGAAVFLNAKQPHLDAYEPGRPAPKPLPALAVRLVTTAVNTPAVNVSWFDFSADGKLWHLLDGKLAAWDLNADKAVIEAPTRDSTSPQDAFAAPCVLMGPDRKWLVVRVEGKYLEVLDAETGECRGRLGGEGGWRALAVSPDGTRLAGVRALSNPYRDPQNSLVTAELHEWDLATGKETGLTSFIADSLNDPEAHWYAPDRLLYAGRAFDLKNRVPLLSIASPSSRRRFSPDGRLWSPQAGGRVTRLKLPTDPPDGEPALRPGDALRVEARCDDPAIDRRVASLMTDTLTRLGYKGDAGGWTLRVTAKLEDTKETLNNGDAVPLVRAKYELVAPDRAVVAARDQVVRCPLGNFFKSADYAPGGAIQPGGGHQINYDFGGRYPATAMREEVWTAFVRSMPEYPWPRTAWRSGGKFVPLPIAVAGPESGG